MTTPEPSRAESLVAFSALTTQEMGEIYRARLVSDAIDANENGFEVEIQSHSDPSVTDVWRLMMASPTLAEDEVEDQTVQYRLSIYTTSITRNGEPIAIPDIAATTGGRLRDFCILYWQALGFRLMQLSTVKGLTIDE